MRTASVVLLALSLPTLTGGCAAMAVAGAVGGVAFVAKDRTLGEGVDETTAGTQVRTSLLAADFGVYSQIAIEVAQGRLLLAGAVPTEAHRTEAERIASGVAAVRFVENNLEVGPHPDVWRTSWDRWISAEIRARLLANDDIKGVNFVVETHRGVVYLLGLARSDIELKKVTEIARHINGVQKVVSYVEVRAPMTHLAGDRAQMKPEAAAAFTDDLDAPAEIAPPPQTRAAPRPQPAPAGRRFEVQYPDEPQARVMTSAPVSREERSLGMQAPQSVASASGQSGLGRSWATPSQIGAPATAQAATRTTAQPSDAFDEAPIEISGGAPLTVSRR